MRVNVKCLEQCVAHSQLSINVSFWLGCFPSFAIGFYAAANNLEHRSEIQVSDSPYSASTAQSAWGWPQCWSMVLAAPAVSGVTSWVAGSQQGLGVWGEGLDDRAAVGCWVGSGQLCLPIHQEEFQYFNNQYSTPGAYRVNSALCSNVISHMRVSIF